MSRLQLLICLLALCCVGSCRRTKQPESLGPPVIHVAEDRIYLDGRPVLASQGTVSSDERLLPALHMQLTGIAGQRRSAEVKACFHKGAPFRIVKRVAYTCGRAGLTRLVAGIAGGPKPADCSAALDAERLIRPVEPSVTTEVHGIHLGQTGYIMLVPRMKNRVQKRGGAYDPPGLVRLLKAGFAARERTVVISAEEEVPLSDVMSAQHAAMGAGYGKTALADLAAEVRKPSYGWSLGSYPPGREPADVGGLRPGLQRPGVGGLRPDVGRRPRRRRPRPRIVLGWAEVRGALSKEEVRRVIRRHINQVKHCYSKALRSDPKLAGRATIQFTINPEGRAVAFRIESATMRISEVEGCIGSAVRRWLFPKPKGGGIAIVSYPFIFRGAR